jgi:hypothetical protein
MREQHVKTVSVTGGTRDTSEKTKRSRQNPQIKQDDQYQHQALKQHARAASIGYGANEMSPH